MKMNTTHTGACTILAELGSIADHHASWRFFGKLYYDTTESINRQLAGLDQRCVELTNRFQHQFAYYFISQCLGTKKNQSPWDVYAAGKDMNPLQYYLLGLNAHINGDMWQALVQCFSEEELDQYHSALLRFQDAITTVYNEYYEQSLASHARFRVIHKLSFGLSRKAGCSFILRCRKLQVQLALLHYRDKREFAKVLYRVQRKKKIVDQIILALLK